MILFPAGALSFFRDSMELPMDRVDTAPLIQRLLMHMEEIAYAHTLAAKTLGKGLKPHLHGIAAVSRDSR